MEAQNRAYRSSKVDEVPKSLEGFEAHKGRKKPVFTGTEEETDKQADIQALMGLYGSILNKDN